MPKSEISVRISLAGATKILLSVNIALLFGSAFVLMAILLENNPEGYAWYYNTTYNIQPFVIGVWLLSLAFSLILAAALLIRFGVEVRKTIQWEISIAIMVFAGLPSLAFVALGFFMHGL